MFQPLVGAEGGDEGLLEGVLGIVRPDGRDEVSEDVGGVLLEHLLEGWKRFTWHLPVKRRTPGFRETVLGR